MTQNIKNPETQKIINTYKVVYKIFFIFGNFIIAVIVSVCILYLLQTQLNAIAVIEASNLTNNNTENTTLPSIGSGNTIYAYQNANIFNNQEAITSNWNIIQYQGYTLPVYNLKAKTAINAVTFTNPEYNIQELEEAIDAIILQETNIRNNNPFAILPPFSIAATQDTPITNNTINQIFNIECIYNSRKISNIVCKKYITHAIQDIFNYNISSYHQELVTLSNNIPTTLHSPFCENLIEYIRKTGDTSSSLDLIVRNICTETQHNIYKNTKELIQANNDIISQKSIKSIGDNNIINEYLIHSLLQEIYNDITKGNINPITIRQYIEAWNTILNKQHQVSTFTYDASYYLNQTLIMPALNNNTLTNRIERNEINTLQANMKKINDGSSSNNEGIQAYITNINIKNEDIINDLANNTSGSSTTDTLHGTYFQEIRRTENENTILIEGEIQPAQGDTIPTTITIDKNNTITNIDLPYDNERENTINNLIQTQRLQSLHAIENFIIDNLNTITSDTIGVCDLLIEYIDTKLTECDDTTIIIQETKNEVPLRYEITIDETMKITNFKINSSHMQERIREEINTLNTNSSTLIPTLVAITNIAREKEEETDPLEDQTGIVDKFVVIDRIKKHMNIEPDNVGQRDNEFVIGITIKGEIFYASYDITTHSITNIILPDITIDNKRVIISEFRLTLSDEYQNDINQFIDDPLGFIKRRYPSVNTLYQNRG